MTVSTLFKNVKMSGVLPHIRNAKRHRSGKKPGIVKVELDSVEWKVEVLKNKDGITSHEDYAHVIVRGSMSHTDRVASINTRTLLKLISGGENFYVAGNGLIKPRDNSSYSAAVTQDDED